MDGETEVHVTRNWQSWEWKPPPLLGFLFPDTTDGTLRKERKESREKGMGRPSEMEGGGGAAINYLGYKFLLFCKVNTQPQRSVAGWVCWGGNEQPSFRWWEQGKEMS